MRPICPLRRSLRDVRLVPPTLAIWFLTVSGVSASPDAPAPGSGFVSRLKAALLVQTLNAELLSHESATATLEGWCSTYGLAPPTLVAERVPGEDKAATEEQRAQLRVSETDVVRYRKVRLRCGSLVLSEADNWYVPGRLTAEMNTSLDTTDTPFGRVVKSLDFRRHTISMTVLSPFLPPGWETMSPARIKRMSQPCLPASLLQHRAILTLPDGTPFSEVVETYTGNVLAFPAAGLTHRCPQ
jgi:hypothetical protein